MKFRPTPHEVRQISAAGAVHPDTIVRAYMGKAVRSTSTERIRRAAAELHLPLPGQTLDVAEGAVSSASTGDHVVATMVADKVNGR